MAKYSTPSGQTGESRNTGTRTYTTTPKTPGHNVTTNAARHATGQNLANVGAKRGGQSEPSGNRPITGVSRSSPIRTQAPRPPVLTDQARTSAGAQRIIPRPPMPFENPQGSVNVPAPTNRTERFSGNNATEGRTRFLRSSSASIHSGTSLSREEMAAVGYDPDATKGTWSLISGHATKNSPRQAGRPGKVNAGTSSRENSRMRQGS